MDVQKTEILQCTVTTGASLCLLHQVQKLHQQRGMLTAMTDVKAAYRNTHVARTQHTPHRDK